MHSRISSPTADLTLSWLHNFNRRHLSLRLLTLCCILFLGITHLHAQQVQIDTLQPDAEYDNVCSKMLYSDSLTTTFVIWIKHRVPLHKHALHTEQVYILSGTGRMQLGDQFFDVKSGDHIFIPMGTPHAVQVTSSTPLQVISIQTPQFDGSDRIKLE